MRYPWLMGGVKRGSEVEAELRRASRTSASRRLRYMFMVSAQQAPWLLPCAQRLQHRACLAWPADSGPAGPLGAAGPSAGRPAGAAAAPAAGQLHGAARLPGTSLLVILHGARHLAAHVAGQPGPRVPRCAALP